MTKTSWHIWKFEPQPDITAYELALILCNRSRDDYGLRKARILSEDVLIPSDEEPGPQVIRHYREVGPMSGEVDAVRVSRASFDTVPA